MRTTFLFQALLPAFLLAAGCDKPRPAKRTPAQGEVLLHVTGMLKGRLDPCGCASNQLGGLPTRKTYLWMRRHIDALQLEGCGFLPPAVFGRPFCDLICTILLRALGDGPGGMALDAMGVGASDCLLGAERLARIAAQCSPPPLVSCNLVDPKGTIRPWVTCTTRGRKVWVTSAAPGPLPPGVSGFRLREWRGALREVLLREAPVDAYRVLLLDGGDREARIAAGLVPGGLDLVVTAKDLYNPTPAADCEPTDSPLVVDPGGGGRNILEVTLTRREGATRNYYIVRPLVPWVAERQEQRPGAVKPDPAISRILREGRNRLYDGQALAGAAALARPIRWQSYLGSRACFPCHPDSTRAWLESGHSRAWRTLVEDEAERGWPITFSPDCVSCHVVGLGHATGFRTPLATPHLLGVGCEECHGPGGLHVRRMMVDPFHPDPAIDRADDGSLHCYRCHTSARQTHKPFDPVKDWQKIEHRERKKWADQVRR